MERNNHFVYFFFSKTCSQTNEKMSGIPYSCLESHFREYEPLLSVVAVVRDFRSTQAELGIGGKKVSAKKTTHRG